MRPFSFFRFAITDQLGSSVISSGLRRLGPQRSAFSAVRSRKIHWSVRIRDIGQYIRDRVKPDQARMRRATVIIGQNAWGGELEVDETWLVFAARDSGHSEV